MYDDGSVDASPAIIKKFKPIFQANNILVAHSRGEEKHGPGYARNRAVEQSSGMYLCFLDSDDVMLPTRIIDQFSALNNAEDTIVGSGFKRIPENSTVHYTKWANTLTDEQLYLQQYRELTLIQPTWFCHRKVFDRVGGYYDGNDISEPEDLIFFQKHLENGGKLKRVDKPLILYRYHDTNLSLLRPLIKLFTTRLRFFERRVLSTKLWENGFVVWGAGKGGQEFLDEIMPEYRSKVLAMCDYDVEQERVFEKTYHLEDGTQQEIKIPIIHFDNVSTGPIACSVGPKRGRNAFESNVRSVMDRLGLIEGETFIYIR